MSSFLGERPDATLSAMRQALGAAPAEPKVTQLPGSDGIVFTPDGSAITLPAVSVRRHVFHDPQSLAGWLGVWSNADITEVLVDETRVLALVDAGVAAHGEIACELRYHPVFDRWRQVFGKKLGQKELHALLRRTIDDFHATEVAMRGGGTERVGVGHRLLNEVGKLQVRKDQSFRQELGQRGETLLRSSDAKNEATVTVPELFEIEVPIFVDVAVGEVEPRYIIRVLVDLDLDGLTPTFTLTAPDLALQLLDARRDVARCLREQLGEGWTVGLGAAKTAVVLTAPRSAVVPFLFAQAEVDDE